MMTRRSLLQWGAMLGLVRGRAARAQEGLPVIRIVGSFGASDPRNLARIAHAVLHVAGEPLRGEEITRLPRTLDVRYDAQGPMAVDGDPKRKRLTLLLSATDRRWAQFAYQFSHEIGHVWCNYRRIDYTDNPYQWLEEALCGAMSLYCLHRLANDAWPFPDGGFGGDYDNTLPSYVNNVRERYGPAPATGGLSAWYKHRAAVLRATRGLYEVNMPLAHWLGDRFIERPQRLAAIRYLNFWDVERTPSLRAHLQNWLDACPEDRRELPLELQRHFAL